MKGVKRSLQNIYVVRLDRGEDIIKLLETFCKLHNIKGSIIQGIGALSYAELYAVNRSDEFSVDKKNISGAMELISAIGNVSTNNDNPIIHIHVCLELNAKQREAGHLLKGIVSYTGEFFIFETEQIIKTKSNNLNLFDL